MTASTNLSTDRRSFIRLAALGALATQLPLLSALAATNRTGVVVHSYAARWQSKTADEQFPPITDALGLLRHCHSIGAGGIQTAIRGWTNAFARQLREESEQVGMYVEGSVALPKDASVLGLFDQEVQIAKEAGINVLRCVSLGPRRYESLHSYQEFLDFQERGLKALQLAVPILEKHRMRLAVENHKDWRSEELLAILHRLESEWVGVTLDFGNSIALMEEPLYTAKLLAPYVFSTHIKDMAVDLHSNGFSMSEVPLGKGILDLQKIGQLCRRYNPQVTFNLEMITRDPLVIPCLTDGYWATFGDRVPASRLAGILAMVTQHRNPLPKVSHLPARELLALEEKNVVSSLAYRIR
ncbi:Xylose isomerase domain protein TIM barrel [Lunatimonas lonarensis]|uniref:Xylose isomerase domain protein TIM barrel n=1 Tax=Lunatimonas lonarensis TaxID=1232681 RepID=R7ZPX3_9BACT|nr:TIM barrel protein [Lunatimonas lonarensis]EON76160.1 Xylose isomerase domain protein TIM barrel [Lunatimonas lonarensis]